jgi:hypothetical protein
MEPSSWAVKRIHKGYCDDASVFWSYQEMYHSLMLHESRDFPLSEASLEGSCTSCLSPFGNHVKSHAKALFICKRGLNYFFRCELHIKSWNDTLLSTQEMTRLIFLWHHFPQCLVCFTLKFISFDCHYIADKQLEYRASNEVPHLHKTMTSYHLHVNKKNKAVCQEIGDSM